MGSLVLKQPDIARATFFPATLLAIEAEKFRPPTGRVLQSVHMLHQLETKKTSRRIHLEKRVLIFLHGLCLDLFADLDYGLKMRLVLLLAGLNNKSVLSPCWITCDLADDEQPLRQRQERNVTTSRLRLRGQKQRYSPWWHRCQTQTCSWQFVKTGQKRWEVVVEGRDGCDRESAGGLKHVAWQDPENTESTGCVPSIQERNFLTFFLQFSSTMTRLSTTARTAIAFLCLQLSWILVQAHLIEVSASKKECFFEDLHTNDQVR